MVKEVTYNWGTCRSIRAKGKLKGKSAFTTTGQVLGMISFKPALKKFQGGQSSLSQRINSAGESAIH